MRQAMLKLEVFETAAPDDDRTVFDAHQAEKLRETAYEQGYAAGWQDALEHMRNEDALRRIAAEDALQSISFGYHEAHAALQKQLIAFTEALLTKLMPNVARDALPLRLAAELETVIAQNITLPLRIACAPDAVATLQPIVESASSVDITLVPEPSFSHAQVALSFGTQERQIDFDRMLDILRGHIRAHLNSPSNKEIAHG